MRAAAPGEHAGLGALAPANGRLGGVISQAAPWGLAHKDDHAGTPASIALNQLAMEEEAEGRAQRGACLPGRPHAARPPG